MDIQCKNPACRKSFPSGFSFSNSKNVTLKGNISVCPYCGFPNGMPEGVFDFENDKPKLVKTISSLPESSLIQLETLIKRTKEQNLRFEEFKEEASLISPAIVDLITRPSRTQVGFMFILALILSIILQTRPEVQVKFSQTVNQIFKKEIRKNVTKQTKQRSIERESFSLSKSKREAKIAKRKFLEEQRKKKGSN
jgi:hypothetical protein